MQPCGISLQEKAGDRSKGRHAGEGGRMEKLLTNSEKIELLKDILQANEIHTYLLVAQGDQENVLAVGKGRQEEIEILLTALMLKDKMMMKIFSEALKMAKAEEARGN